MVYTFFIDSDAIGSGPFTARLRVSALVFPWGAESLLVRDFHTGAVVPFNELSPADQREIAELLRAKVQEKRDLADECTALRRAWERKLA